MTKQEISEIVREVLLEQQRTIAPVTDAATLRVVSGILRSFGINDDDVSEIREDFAYLRRWRKTSEQISRGGWIAVMTVFVSGIASAIFIGVKAILAFKGG